MPIRPILVAALSAFVLLVLPHAAPAAGPDRGSGAAAERPGPPDHAGPPEQAGSDEADEDANPGSNAGSRRAYGRLCKGQSKRRAKGEKGTPFSRCVTAMAELAGDEEDSPRAACEGLSKRRVKGEKGTPFSRCVVAGARLLDDLAEEGEGEENEVEEDPEPT